MPFSNIKIVLILGPYRNLTTMLATYMNLHKNIIVFNHGYDRMKDVGCDFWNKLTIESYNNFIEFVKKNYLSGKKGDYGGDITLAHASQKKNIISKYAIPIKRDIKYIVLKESGFITNDLRNDFNDFNTINNFMSVFRDKIYFIRPIRTILKSVLSNLITGHYIKYCDLKNKQMLKWYLQDLNWFYNCKKKNIKYFCYFYEKDINNINNIYCKFLELELIDTLCYDVKITDTTSYNINQEDSLVIKNLFYNNEINKELFNELIHNDSSMSELNNIIKII